MPIYRVYHKKDFMFNYAEADKTTMFDSDLYNWVADVHTDSIDMVFQLTNHIDIEWWNNDEVKIYKHSRSTSVGDVIYDVDAGKHFLCMPVGWKGLTDGDRWLAIDHEDNLFKADPKPRIKTYDVPTSVYTMTNPNDGVEYVIRRTYSHPKADWEVVHPF